MQRRLRRRGVNPYRGVRQWPTQPEDDAPEGEFLDRYRDISRVGIITPEQWRLISSKTGTGVPAQAGAQPGGVVDDVPVGIAPPTPTVRQARFVNLAATVGTVAVQLLAANQKRTYLIIVNTSATTIFITFDRPASISTGVPIVSNGNYEPLTPPVSSVWAIALLNNLPTVVVEGTT